eukprot:CAMPEP_0202845678 /NCGR_PEP_ID=MMETSP1389-20130828/70580_1 /ASSEMBLY_ACC=CAM_ASM_000865 /TAXON_ID=302021 /ORGANISM="Rhodomonas sp., Strain CCMP768" /LENGTH=131 /DNA_ID=CAMNT_0049523141 /DNA_START=313 /DNA_END=708 /DNA_ORIENTATION=+
MSRGLNSKGRAGASMCSPSPLWAAGCRLRVGGAGEERDELPLHDKHQRDVEMLVRLGADDLLEVSDDEFEACCAELRCRKPLSCLEEANNALDRDLRQERDFAQPFEIVDEVTVGQLQHLQRHGRLEMNVA